MPPEHTSDTTTDTAAATTPSDTSHDDAAPATRSALWRWGRVALLALMLITAYVLASSSGLLKSLSTESVRQWVSQAGWWGLPLYFGVYTAGYLLQVPGLVFIAAAVVAFGRFEGALLGWLGTMMAVAVSFWVVRLIGGRPFDGVQSPRMKRLLAQLDQRPVRATALLRLFFFAAPPVTYALALSGMRFRDYMIGSVIGLTPTLAVLIFFFDAIFNG